jgi:hypothetical protein
MMAGVDDTIAPNGIARIVLISPAASKPAGAAVAPLKYGASVLA